MLRRVLITLDAVGGVWRYALDVARGLDALGVMCLLVGFGPEPDAAQQAECAGRDIVWTGEPLDWTVSDSAALDSGTERLAVLAASWDADLLHLNLPSQAVGLPRDLAVVVASHSCVPTWWQTVHGTSHPDSWLWLRQRNQEGFRRAGAVVVPSASHGIALRRVYSDMPPLSVVHNASTAAPSDSPKDPMILAVGRWWDAGKNGKTLDAAASAVPWPVVMVGPLSGPDGQSVTLRNAQAPGTIAHSDVLDLMRRAAVFAAPSLYEPFGLAVVEAARSGAALVLSDIPTFRELWHGAALFVDPDDVAGWARACSKLATDPALRQRLAMQSQTRAGGFSLPRQAARLLDVYTSVLVPAQ